MSQNSSGGLGERNKAKRRDAILDAALELFDVNPSSAVTTDQIAARAEVSPATVYNLIGRREEVLRAIAVRFIQRMTVVLATEAADGSSSREPMWLQRLLIERSLTALREHSQAYRHVISYLGGLGTSAQDLQSEDGPTPDPVEFHATSVALAQRAGAIRKNLDPTAIALQVADNLNGTLIRWSFGRLDDDLLVPLAMHGLVALLLAVSTDRERPRLEAELLKLNRQLKRGHIASI
jgi:AcrR family transcriptional regulator